MKPEELTAIRVRFGLTKREFAYALGYSGNRNTLHLMMDRYESGRKPIPLTFARFVWLLDEWRMLNNDAGSPDLNGMPQWPVWSEYSQVVES
jgi:hypothetical protein